MRVNNKRKQAHEMHANVRKRALLHAFFDTRLRENGACILRVRRPLISDLYCTSKTAKKSIFFHVHDTTILVFNLTLLQVQSLSVKLVFFGRL